MDLVEREIEFPTLRCCAAQNRWMVRFGSEGTRLAMNHLSLEALSGAFTLSATVRTCFFFSRTPDSKKQFGNVEHINSDDQLYPH